MARAHREARFLLTALVAVLVLVVLIVLPYVNTITLAVVIGIVFMPLADWLRKYLKRDGLTALVTLLVALLLVVTPLAFFAFEAGNEALGLYARVTRDHTIGELSTASLSLEGVAARLPVSVRDALPDRVDVGPIIRSGASWVVDRVGSLFGIVTGLALDLFLLGIGTYYVLKDGRRFAKYLLALAPLEQQYEDLLFRKLHASVTAVVRGSLGIAVIQGVLAGAGFFALGVPNAALWGAATMIASFIPIIGTAFTLIPAIAYLFITGSPIPALILAAWSFLVVGFVDNAFRSMIMKKGMDIHPFLILLSVLGGLEFFGPIGFISGPLLLAILMALLDIYTASRDRADALDPSATLNS